MASIIVPQQAALVFSARRSEKPGGLPLEFTERYGRLSDQNRPLI